MNIERKTDTWCLYEEGKNFNRLHNVYENTRENYNYFLGRQWDGLKRPKGSQEPVVLNIVKPIVKYKVNIINQNSYKIVFNPNTYENADELAYLTDVTKGLNRFMEKMIEKTQFGKKVKSNVKNACINSEGILHFFIEEDEKEQLIQTEEIDKNNLYLGNENTSDIQDQPYILCVYREPVQKVRDRAKLMREKGKNNLTDEEILSIQGDMDFNEQAGKEFMLHEIVPMCIVIKKFERIDGIVHISESTHTCDIMSPESTERKLYPFAHFVWEQEKGYSRGIGEVSPLLENQREINKTATRRAMSVRMFAYPKLAVNSSHVKNPESLYNIGSAIELQNMRADDVRKEVTYLNPASMSADALNLQENLITQTRDLAGAGDTATGNVDPEKTSGRAILLVQQASQQPLNEQLDNYRYYLEDCAKIIFEMIKVNYLEGITLYHTEDKLNQLGEFDTFETPFKISQKELEKANIDIKIDITSTSVYDVNNQIGTLENLLTTGNITLEEFVKALPDAGSNIKPMLEKIIKDRKEAQKQITQMRMKMMTIDNAVNQILIEDGGDNVDMSSMQEGGDVRNQGGRGEQQNNPQMQEM